MASEFPGHENLAQAPFSFLHDESIRLLLVGGKGGVGKTTTAAALSVYLAHKFPRRRCLLVSTGPLHSLSNILGFPLDSTAKPVYRRKNLFALEMDALKLLSDFKARHWRALRAILSRGTYLDDEDISRFLELSFPGLDELMAMMHIIDLLQSEQYDTLVVDTAPTGHTLRLLSLPALTTAWVSILDRMMEKHRFMSRAYTRRYRKDEADDFIDTLNRDISRLAATLRNHHNCRFVAVTLLEPVVVAETERLLVALREKGISVARVVINQFLSEKNACALCGSIQTAQEKSVGFLADCPGALGITLFPAFLPEVEGEMQLKFLLSCAQACTVSTVRKTVGPVESRVPPVSPNLRFPPGPGLAIPSPQPGLEFFLFCGKGGVGKTTLACAFALQLSQRSQDKKVLLFSTDPAHSLSDCLAQRIGPEQTQVEGTTNLFAIEIDPDALFQAWKRAYSLQIDEVFGELSQRVGIDLQFDHDALAGLLDLTPPGLDELMCISELANLVEQHRYDFYVLDTAPAGHTLRFLELFIVVRDWLRTFFGILLRYRNIARLPKVSESLVEMSQRVKTIHRILTNPKKCQAIPVTIPTKAARDETERLLAALKRSGILFKSLLVNQVIAASTDCTYCAAVAADHENELREYRRAFSDLEVLVLLRWPGALRGGDALAGLLRFASPDGVPLGEPDRIIKEQIQLTT